MSTIYYGYGGSTRFPVQDGAGVNPPNTSGGDTPLHFAVNSSDIDSAKTLLDKGANINAQNNDGESPLHIAIKKKNIKMAYLLMERGADIRLSDTKGNEPLHLAVESEDYYFVDDLFRDRVDVNAQNNDGQSPLHIALKKKNVDIALLLLTNRNVNINLEDHHHNTPFNLACDLPESSIALEMMKRRKVTYVENDLGYSPLFNAASRGHLELVKALCENKENLVTPNRFGRTVFHTAAEAGQFKIVEWMLEQGIDPNTPIEQVTCFSRFEDKGKTPLHLAAERHHSEILKLLIQYGGDVHRCDEGHKRTPLHHAVRLAGLSSDQLKKTLSLLISQEVDINAQDLTKYTPLMLAAANGNLYAVQKLLDSGADFSIANFFGDTALTQAAKNCHLDIVTLLLSKGADPTHTNLNGTSSLDLLTNIKDQELDRLLAPYRHHSK